MLKAICLFLLVIGFVFFARYNLARFRRIDAKIRYLYEHDRDRWVQLGRPIGYFWRPDEDLPFFQSFYARNSLNSDFADDTQKTFNANQHERK